MTVSEKTQYGSHAMSEPTLDQDTVQAQEVVAITIAEYDRMAAVYRRGTADHDVSQNIAALLKAIEGEAPYVILDLGCGPGRDLRQFTALGHEAVGLDGSAELSAMARANTDCEVLHQDFLALDLHPPASTGSSQMPRCSTCRVASSPGSSATSRRPSSPAESCSARTRGATTRKVGPVGATAAFMISKRGAPTSPPRVFASCTTTTARRAGRGRSSRGWPRSGARARGISLNSALLFIHLHPSSPASIARVPSHLNGTMT